MMLAHKDAKTMARSLRDALGHRNIPLSHSDCLEIVARQFGLPDWNTLSAKLLNDQERGRSQEIDAAMLAASSTGVAVTATTPTLTESQTPPQVDVGSEAVRTPPPWTTCSFCGKSRPEVRILLGGCGGWEGFRARRNPESGERSNVFICNECVELVGKISVSATGAANGLPP